MAGIGSKIVAVDYNNIQSKISLIFGTGSLDYGYGQTILSSQVAVGNRVSSLQWSNLRSDLIKARYHQTGVDPSSSLTDPTTVTRVTEADRAAYSAFADVVTASRLTSPPAGQASREPLVAPAVRTTAWNGVITHTITVNFSTADDARFYFNTGSQIWFSASRTGGGTGTKNTSWTTMLTNMGIIKFGYTDTTATGTGSTSVIGYYDLTTSDQLIFQKSTEAPVYSPNKYNVYARLGTPSSGVQIIFTVQFRDDSAQPNAPYGTDEDVDGTLTSTVEGYRASGTNVSVGLPPATSSGI